MQTKKSGRDNPRFQEVKTYHQIGDVAEHGKHKSTVSEAAHQFDQDQISQEHEVLMRDGYIILNDVVSPEQMDQLRSDSQAHLKHMGRNTFEGERTQRIYGLPAKMRSADPFIEHPHILAHLDRLLMPNYLLSQAQIINIKTDSPAQHLHIDDGFYKVPAPRPALSVATVFAIDDFTEDNGATVILPGSHLWGEDREPQEDDPRVKAVMPAGSCILFLGNAWHGGGVNQSGADRMALTCQYCEPWLRTQENYFLSVSKETAASVSENIRRMLGYSIHPPFMGMTQGVHPKRVLPDFD